MTALREQIGKYPIVDVAGQGNMGIVFVAYDPYADRDVAIKVCSLGKELSDKASRIARKLFFNEAHMAGVLDHPNILKILDAGEVDADPYVVMEYVEGGRNLASHCQAESALPIEQVAEHIAKCATALDYAHRRGVIHRDIKPSNLMLTESGVVKVGDFGIAVRAFDDTTRILGLVGSPRYMSPEQVEDKELNGQTDIYSLGVVLFELLTGRPPFMAKKLSELVHQIQYEEPPRLRDLRPELPGSLDSIIRCALEKDLAHRYQTGAEMARDLMTVFGKLRTAKFEDMVGPRAFAMVRGLSFFNEFSDPELREIIEQSEWTTRGPGEPICPPDNSEYSFYIVISGDISVNRGGRRVATLSPGHCFGVFGERDATDETQFNSINEASLLRVANRHLEQTSDLCQLRFNKAFLHSLLERLGKRGQDMAPFFWQESGGSDRAA